MATIRKARRSQRVELQQSQRELCALPARLLTRLPVETRIIVQAKATKTEFVLTTAPAAPPDAVTRQSTRQSMSSEHRLPCWFSASEVDALVLGVEAERTVSSDLKAFALGKLRDRSFRVTAEHALAGAQPPAEAGEHEGAYARRSMTVGQVLEALELEIIGIELGPFDHGAGQEQDAAAAPARAA